MANVRLLAYHPREEAYPRSVFADDSHESLSLINVSQYANNLPSFLKGARCFGLQVVRSNSSACCHGHDPCRESLDITAMLWEVATDWALCVPKEYTPGKKHMFVNASLIRLSSEAHKRDDQVTELWNSEMFKAIHVITPTELEAKLAQLLIDLPRNPPHHLHVQVVPASWDAASPTVSTGPSHLRVRRELPSDYIVGFDMAGLLELMQVVTIADSAVTV